MVARGVREKSYRVMQGVRKRYKDAKEKVILCDQQAKVKSHMSPEVD